MPGPWPSAGTSWVPSMFPESSRSLWLAAKALEDNAWGLLVTPQYTPRYLVRVGAHLFFWRKIGRMYVKFFEITFIAFSSQQPW